VLTRNAYAPAFVTVIRTHYVRAFDEHAADTSPWSPPRNYPLFTHCQHWNSFETMKLISRARG